MSDAKKPDDTTPPDHWDTFTVEKNGKGKFILDDKGLKYGCRGSKSRRLPVSPPTPISEYLGEEFQAAPCEGIRDKPTQRRTGRPLDQNLILRDLAVSAAVEIAVRADEYRAIDAALAKFSIDAEKTYQLTVEKILTYLYNVNQRTQIVKSLNIPEDIFKYIIRKSNFTRIHGEHSINKPKTIHEKIEDKYGISCDLVSSIMKRYPERGRRSKPSSGPRARLWAQMHGWSAKN